MTTSPIASPEPASAVPPADDLRAADARFRVLFERSSDPHLIFDQSSGICNCNDAAVRILGARGRAEVLALHPAQLSPEFQPDGRRSLEKAAEMDAEARRTGSHRFEWVHRRCDDGHPFTVHVTLNPVQVGGRPAMVVVWHDLAPLRREQAVADRRREQLRALAHRLKVRNRELRDASSRIAGELATIARIQRSLLPAGLPDIPGLRVAASYRTSAAVGGDYYDFFALPRGCWGVLLADVSGHGAPAAVVMAITHALAHGYGGPQDPPEALLCHLNRVLTARYVREGGFVTAFYAVYDPAERSLAYARAGHNPPRWRRRCPASGRPEVIPLDGAASLPLGIVEDGGPAEAERIRLSPGDDLLLYTDGITEARDAATGAMLETDGLDDVLLRHGGRGDPSSLVAAVAGAAGDRDVAGAPRDDQTVIGLCVVDQP